MAKQKIKAFAYLRTSSAANVGADKDSERRQREAVGAFARRAGYEIEAVFFDAAVSGADPIETRSGFSALLDRIEANGVRVVIVEDASRFARELMTQELGLVALIGRGVTVLTATGDDLTNTTDPMKTAMRQIAGAFAQLEKARLVAKLKAARDRKRLEGKKASGRKSHAEARPKTVELALQIRAAGVEAGKKVSLAKISAKLAEAGHLNEQGRPFNHNSVRAMLRGKAPQRVA